MQGRSPAVLQEYPVELRKTTKSAAIEDINHPEVGGDQHLLSPADTDQLKVVRECETSHLLELMGKIIPADAELSRDTVQVNLLIILGMQIGGDLLDLCHDRVTVPKCGIVIDILKRHELIHEIEEE